MIVRRKFRTKRARKRENVIVSLKISGILTCLVLLIVGFGYVSRLEELRIMQVLVNTDGALQNDGLASALHAELEGNHLGLIPKDSVLLFGHKRLESALKTKFARIEDVAVRRSSFYTISASVVEREPKALWCGDVVPEVAQESTSDELRATENLWGTCYFIDSKGYIYSKAPIFSGNIFPRYYGSLDHAEPIGQQYIPEKEFIKWQTFYDSIAHEDVVSQALLFVDERDIELYLTNGLRVLISRNDDNKKLTQRTLAVLTSGEIDLSKRVEYVDLRFGNKAFIKYSSEKETL